MKYLMRVLNCLLIIMIPVTFIMTPVHKEKAIVLKSDNKIKKLKSASIKLEKKEEIKKEEQNKEQKPEEQQEVKKETVQNEKTLVNNNTKVENKPIVRQTQPRIVSKPVQTKPVTDVLETKVGKMSGYGPDCKGCSGNLASGINAKNGNIYYNDKKYGRIRIVAGDRSYKFGTIVRIKNSRAGNNIIAIVLDRGSNIGIGKKFLFDLLYPSSKEAAKDEVSYNVTFEILRYGY
ncbi:MAG: hypothetical protein IJF92_03660 [Bacilli bacterium]|nr:hypothetical protein [Bacilli bacterium]